MGHPFFIEIKPQHPGKQQLNDLQQITGPAGKVRDCVFLSPITLCEVFKYRKPQSQ